MLSGKKTVRKFILLCAFVYFVSYVTRVNYQAVITAMCEAMGETEATLSVALTGSFITYGAGQLVSGFLGDHFHPKKLLSLGLIATSVLNLLVPFFHSPAMLAVLWSINGFAQSFMWPPLVKTMLMLLSMEDYESQAVNVSFGSSGGTMFVYAAGSLCILIAGWQSVFILSGIIGLVGLFVWNRYCPDFTITFPERKAVGSRKKSTAKLWTPLLVLAVLGILAQGILRDGTASYMPSFIKDTYKLSSESAILSGVLMPVFSLACTKLAAKLHLKWLSNLLLCAFLLFGLSAVSAVLLYFFYDVTPLLTILLLAILNACTHGVNLMLISYLPAHLADKSRLSTMAGLTNSFAYLGSAIATYAIPLAVKDASWSATLPIWSGVAIVGMLICALGIPLYRHKLKKEAVH